MKWLPGKLTKDESKALAFAYITSPEVQNRLDTVVGIAGWKISYRPGPLGGVMGELSLRLDGEWITKEDVGENTEFQAIKGGVSDAIKRAGVVWGIGRYLRNIPPQWVPCEKFGSVVRFTQEPRIPREFLPGGTPMQEPQPMPANLDKATGELQDEEPLPATPNDGPMPERQPTPINRPAPTGDLQTEWNTLCKLMQAAKPPLPSGIVGQSMGGKFDRNTFANWLQNGTNRSAASLIDDAIRDRERATAPS